MNGDNRMKQLDERSLKRLVSGRYIASLFKKKRFGKLKKSTY